MQTLYLFYIRAISAVAIAFALAAYLIPTHVQPWLQKAGASAALNWLLGHATDRVVIVLLLAATEWLIRQKLWRWKGFYPKLDFAGVWKGSTTYRHVHVGSISSLPQTADQNVTFTQDCLSIRLVPSEGHDFVFKSRCIDIQDEGAQLVYAYHVSYLNAPPDRPPEAYGFEWLDVVAYGENGKPAKLKGKFAHCANGQTPVLSGDVVLNRVDDPGTFWPIMQRIATLLKTKGEPAR